MELDIELYRREVRVAAAPAVRLSVIDIAPDHPQHTFVFIHGYGGQARQWKYQLQKFSARNRVIALDLRGHGRSDQPASSYSMAEILGDVQAALDVLGVAGPFVLVGHSFGGAIAAEFAAAHPERIEYLVLIAAAGEYRLNPLYRLLLRLPRATLGLVSPLTRSWLSAPPQVMHPWYHNNLSQWNGWELFRRLHVPALVIRGHLDIVFERPMFEEVARAIPLAEEVDVGYSGHMVMLERREAVNRAIEGFLKESRRSWRNDEQADESIWRYNLLKTRPWLAQYESSVPYTIAVPRVPLHYLLRSAARRFAGRPALIFEGARLTYRQLQARVNRFSSALRGLGVQPGERVLLLLPNLPQMVVAFYGVLAAGGVAVFTLPTTEPDELVRLVRQTGARWMVALSHSQETVRRLQAEAGLQGAILTQVADGLTPLQRLLLRVSRRRAALEGPPIAAEPGLHAYADLLAAQAESAPGVEVDPGGLAAIIYTGGTTATPKGVMLSHANLVANTLQVRHWIPEAQEGREVFLCVLPFAHSYGLTTALSVPIALGAALLLKPRFEVNDALRLIQRGRPTIFPGVPGMYVAINNAPGVRKVDIRSIKACISGAAPLPVEVQEAFERLTRARLVEGYGLTEASPVTHANPLSGLRKVGSIGIPLPSTEARLVDLARGREEVPAGQIGELAIRGPQVMQGYWENPQATREVLTPEGWLLTGDVAQMDPDGYFRIIARKADMWYPSRPGEPAFPRDVEEVLFEIPQVKEAAVVAVAGQAIAFLITRDERPSREAVTAYCKRRLPPELVPRLILYVDDFPRTFIGKVLRRELARRYSESRYAYPGQADNL